MGSFECNCGEGYIGNGFKCTGKIFCENRIGLRYANDEIVNSKGRVTLRFSIGSRSEDMIFSIMPSLFPRVIIGLRQMKHSRMVIDPPEDSLWVEGERVKFISKTEELSRVNM